MDRQPLDDEARALRRREARRRIRRRRWTAGAGLVAGVLGVAAVLAVTGAGSSGSGHDATTSGTGAAIKRPVKHQTATAPGRAPEPAAAASEPPGRPIPILMYHAIEAAPAGSALPELWVPAETFAATMDALHDRGYHAISMQDAYDYWKGRRRVPRHPIVLTFDDGFRSQVTNAMPTLKRLGWSGVLYLEVAALHTPGAEGIGKGGVRSLLRAGWELGSHTMTHPDLTTVAPDALHEEVAGARAWLRREFDVPVNGFCYPAGKYDDAVVAAVSGAGYATATTVEPGLAGPGDLLRLPRIRVNASDDADSVLQHLADAGADIDS
jgi:peptidoglycan/xylan/chitin deacetylase (PgdA/CDA1 family)